jgi:hypothetical protein
MELKEQDLIMIRLNNDPDKEGRQRHYNTWFRVMFIDTDGTFIGRVEKIDQHEFELYKIGEYVRLDIDKVQIKYEAGQQWCYSDDITICECNSFCRNK